MPGYTFIANGGEFPNKPHLMEAVFMNEGGDTSSFNLCYKTSKQKLKRKANTMIPQSVVYLPRSSNEILFSCPENPKSVLQLLPDRKEGGFFLFIETKGGRSSARRPQKYMLLQAHARYTLVSDSQWVLQRLTFFRFKDKQTINLDFAAYSGDCVLAHGASPNPLLLGDPFGSELGDQERVSAETKQFVTDKLYELLDEVSPDGFTQENVLSPESFDHGEKKQSEDKNLGLVFDLSFSNDNSFPSTHNLYEHSKEEEGKEEHDEFWNLPLNPGEGVGKKRKRQVRTSTPSKKQKKERCVSNRERGTDKPGSEFRAKVLHAFEEAQVATPSCSGVRCCQEVEKFMWILRRWRNRHMWFNVEPLNAVLCHVLKAQGVCAEVCLGYRLNSVLEARKEAIRHIWIEVHGRKYDVSSNLDPLLRFAEREGVPYLNEKKLKSRIKNHLWHSYYTKEVSCVAPLLISDQQYYHHDVVDTSYKLLKKLPPGFSVRSPSTPESDATSPTNLLGMKIVTQNQQLFVRQLPESHQSLLDDLLSPWELLKLSFRTDRKIAILKRKSKTGRLLVQRPCTGFEKLLQPRDEIVAVRKGGSKYYCQGPQRMLDFLDQGDQEQIELTILRQTRV